MAKMRELSQHQVTVEQEFGHRLINGLQMIVSLLSLQSWNAASPEASAQLTIAANRIAAFGRVHRRLHLLDHKDQVEFKQYLQDLCKDLSGLLCEDGASTDIVVEGSTVHLPSTFAIPLGLITNELITNSVKYAKGRIIVRLETISPSRHALSVSDDGPGLGEGFDPARSGGLGMKIVRSVVNQIGGAFERSSGDNGQGARFSVAFCFPQPGSGGA